MSKKKQSSGKAPPAPSFQNSANFLGDQLVSRTYMDPQYGVTTKYTPDQVQLDSQKQAQARINQILPTLGQTSPEMAKEYDNMANSYADQATAAFNREYEPAQRNLREDYASRFGTLQATPYLDAQADMENRVRVPALLDIANTAVQKKQDLYNTAQQQKLNELQGLGYVLNGDQTAFLQNLQNPQQVSANTNTFNLGKYQQQLAQLNANREFQLKQAQYSPLSQIINGVNAAANAGKAVAAFI